MTPLEICPICSKGYKNLGWHLGMAHKAEVMKKFQANESEEEDEVYEEEPQQEIVKRREFSEPLPSSTSRLIREKLNTILDIKIMEMLVNPSKSGSGMELMQLSSAINPPRSASVGELKEMFKLFQEMQPEQEEEEESGYIETPNEWINVAQQLMPSIKAYLEKKAEVKKENAGANSGIKDTINDADKIAESVINNPTTTGTNG